MILLVVLVTAGGIWSAMQLKKETMPDIAIPIVAIVTPYPGAAPGDVYDQVTEPIEKSMRGVAGIKRVRAQSGDSVSMVIAEFGYSQDMDKAESDVNKALAAVKLPENALAPNVSRISFGSAPIMKLAVIAKDPGTTEALRSDVRERVLPALQGVQGVGEAKLAADSPAVDQDRARPRALEDEGLTADTVIKQLQAANLSFPVGTVDLGVTTEPIRVGGSIASVDDVKEFQVAVYPNQNEIMGDAFAQIGTGMGALGKAMGQGFSALGKGMGTSGRRHGRDRHAGRHDQRDPADPGSDVLAQVRHLAAAEEGGLEHAHGHAAVRVAAGADQADRDRGAARHAVGGGRTAEAGHRFSEEAPSAGEVSLVRRQHVIERRKFVGLVSRASAPEMSIGVVRLGDIAKVTYAPVDGSVGSRANGSPAALIDIVKTQDGNTVEVTDKVTAEMDKLQAGFPVPTKVLTVYDASTGINGSVNGMMREGLLGALFAIIVILLFLRNWRATIIAAISIPLSILIAMVFLKQANVTLNVMTLGGLTVAIGRVVDDSIVVIENIFRHLQRGEKPNAELIRVAVSEVSGAITTSTLTTVAVFLPLGLVTGVIGKVFLPFAITVALALLASLLVAITVVPLMAKWFLLKSKMPTEDKGESKWLGLYRRALGWSLDHRLVIVSASLVLFVGSLALVPLIGTGFVPESKEKYVQIEVGYPEGTKATEVDKAVRTIEAGLAKDGDIELYQSTVGASTTQVSMSGGLGGSNTAMTYVRLKPTASTDEVIKRLQAKMKGTLPEGAEVVYQRVDSSGTNSSLEMIVTGDNLADIRTASDTIEKALKDQSGLTNVKSNLGTARKQVVVDVDQTKSTEYGLNAAMVAGTVRGFVADQKAGSIKVAGQPTDVFYSLKLDPVAKAEEMRKLKLTTPLGKTIKLSKIAKVEETESPVAVLTRDGTEYASVSGRITERDTGSVIKAVEAKVATLKLPAGVTVETGGTAEQMNESFSQLGVAMLIAIGAVYLVMIIAFGEAVAPLAIMMSLPLAVVGGLVGLFLAGLPLDIPAMIGALMLIGIVVTNAIVLVDRVRQKERTGFARRDALLEAGSTRMRPILMTAVATIMALVPLASGFSEGALISQSLAVIVIGGLTTSTLLTLVVVPVA